MDNEHFKRELTQFLGIYIPSVYFSLDGYKEEAVCIEKVNDSSWIIYEAERNKKIIIGEVNSFDLACDFLLKYFYKDNNDYLIISKYFKLFQKKILRSYELKIKLRKRHSLKSKIKFERFKRS